MCGDIQYTLHVDIYLYQYNWVFSRLLKLKSNDITICFCLFVLCLIYNIYLLLILTNILKLFCGFLVVVVLAAAFHCVTHKHINYIKIQIYDLSTGLYSIYALSFFLFLILHAAP